MKMQHRIRDILQSALRSFGPFWIINSVFFICSAILLSTLAVMFFSAHSVLQHNAALTRMVHRIELHAALAHLWFEEALSGDTSVQINDVRQHLNKSRQALETVLSGGPVPSGYMEPVKDSPLRADFEEMQTILNRYSRATEQRWTRLDESASGSAIDQQYDTLFEAFLTHTARVQDTLQDVLQADARVFNRIGGSLLIVCTIVVAVTAALVNYVLRYQARTRQKLLAFNQQLQAGEQQLRAANQQLVANEQQLRAANQQLTASESQLKAYSEQQARTHQQLLESEERFRLLMQESPSVIEVYDRSGWQIDVNAAYEKMWGFPAEHTLGQFNILQSEEIKRIGNMPYIERAYAGETVELPEYEFDATGQTEGRGLGRKRWLFTRIYPIKDGNGTVQNIVLTHEDITARKQAEREREKLMQLLQSRNEELQSIVYVSSHDLKSPLVNIDGFSRLLSKHCEQLRRAVYDKTSIKQSTTAVHKLLEEDIPEDLDFIVRSAHKMNALIDGLLQVSRAGTAVINVTQLDMNNLVDGIVRNLTYKIQQINAAVTVHELQPCIGDPEQIAQVFTNLIENSLKYIHPERTPQIEISCTEQGNEVTYCVADNGIGIDPAYHAKVFEIFHRLNPAQTAEGEGLGLAIVRRILDRHQGRVRVESLPDQGSKFFVTLHHKEAP